MIRHCVLLRFASNITATDRQGIYDELRALKPKIDGLVAASFGANVSPEGFAQGFNDGFTIDFRDAAARDAYLVHPDHQAAGGKLVSMLAGGVAGLVVFDLELA